MLLQTLTKTDSPSSIWEGIEMNLVGSVKFNATRDHWYVRLRWQGQRKYFSQIPTRGDDWLECRTQEMAEHLQREISREVDRGVFHPARWQRSRPMRFKFFASEWLTRQQHIRHATLCGYQCSLRNHLIPALGDKFIGDINHSDYEDLYNALQLSPKSKKNVFVCLFKIIEDAKRSGILAQVPERLRFDGPRSIHQNEIKWITAETFERIMEKMPPEHQPIFRFLFWTGCRPSEARALQWRDIRPDHIMITRTWTHGKGKAELQPPKNRKIQPIPLGDAVRLLLESVRSNQKILTEWVFIDPRYSRPYSHMLPLIWNPACKAVLGYGIRLYNLRHSFANGLLAGGVDIETVSRLLRHSSTAITQEHYGRPHLQVLKQAVDNVQKIR
jgi:integrase